MTENANIEAMKKRLREKAAQFHELLNNPVGKNLVDILTEEFDKPDLRGDSVENTYYNLGARDVSPTFNNSNEFTTKRARYKMPLELPDGWRDELPEDVKTNGALDDVTTIDQMATMIVNGRKLQSNSINIPSADAGEEKQKEFLKDLQAKVPDLVYVGEGAEMDTIYDRMGRPEAPTAYELPEIPDPLKDNFAGLTQKAHELGITKSQMKGISEQILGDFDANVSKSVAAVDEAIGEIKKEYGEAFESRLQKSADFAKQIGFDEALVEAVSNGHLGLANMKALDKLQEGFKSPGPRIGDDPGSSEFTHMTPEQAELKLVEIQNNKEHPYWDGASPGHDAAVKQYVELVRAAEAGKPKTENEKFRDALLGNG